MIGPQMPGPDARADSRSMLTADAVVDIDNWHSTAPALEQAYRRYRDVLHVGIMVDPALGQSPADESAIELRAVGLLLACVCEMSASLHPLAP